MFRCWLLGHYWVVRGRWTVCRRCDAQRWIGPR